MSEPVIAVFCGGTSAEREVSLGSGLACAVALARSFPTRMFDVTGDALPAGFDPRTQVVFSTLHGTFGEDGGMQRLLDGARAHYAGCDAASSALTMDKTRTKETAAKHGVRVAKGLQFAADAKPSVESVVEQLGENLVVKPNAEGSSVGLSLVARRSDLAAALSKITSGVWLVEQRIMGRELSVGVLAARRSEWWRSGRSPASTTMRASTRRARRSISRRLRWRRKSPRMRAPPPPRPAPPAVAETTRARTSCSPRKTSFICWKSTHCPA